MADFPERDILADDADQLLLATARGDHLAFERLYKATRRACTPCACAC